MLALNWANALSDRCAVTLGLHNRKIFVAKAQTQQIDLESVHGLIRFFEQASTQVVIHTAGLTSVDRCEVEPELARHLNVTLAANVAKACAITGVKLVHISTDHLFSGKTSLVDENQPIAPINLYGQTKAEAEFQVLNANPDSLVIRTNFYCWGTTYRNSFSDIVINALRSGQELTLFHDVLYTPILAETLALTVHDLIDLKSSGIFNVVSDERISKYEFGLKIAKEFNLDSSYLIPGLIQDQEAFVRRPHDMTLSNKKVCDLLGRRLGLISEHLANLHFQELTGLAQDMRSL